MSKEIEGLENLRLTDEEESECAHVFMTRFQNNWLLHFDFRYNKGLARRHFQTAKQFYESAQSNYQDKLWAPFVDNLFSTIELLAKVELLLIPDEKFRKKATHKAIQIRYNNWVNIGNAKLDYKTALNKLNGLRNSARYSKSDLKLSEAEAQKYLDITDKMFNYLAPRLKSYF